MEEIGIEIIGWLGSILILYAFAMNALGKIEASSKQYQWVNLIGGTCFIINTVHHKAYPSAVLNVVWVFIALYSILNIKNWKK